MLIIIAVLRLSSNILDLEHAVIVNRSPGSPMMNSYAELLADEIFRRTFCRWPITGESAPGRPTVEISAISDVEVDRRSTDAEGYTVKVELNAGRVTIRGVDRYGRPTLTPALPIRQESYPRRHCFVCRFRRPQSSHDRSTDNIVVGSAAVSCTGSGDCSAR